MKVVYRVFCASIVVLRPTVSLSLVQSINAKKAREVAVALLEGEDNEFEFRFLFFFPVNDVWWYVIFFFFGGNSGCLVSDSDGVCLIDVRNDSSF